VLFILLACYSMNKCLKHILFVEEDSDECPEDWSKFGNRCFIFIDTPKTWVDAEVYCQYEGANLASVHCEKGNRFIMSLTRGDTHNFPETWLGGFDIGENVNFPTNPCI
uniref:C-type lectin domain-containing protein n=1 Tax=Anabas testudineus TaxID=64144 RepID=A0A3Q1JN50_ANATE